MTIKIILGSITAMTCIYDLIMAGKAHGWTDHAQDDERNRRLRLAFWMAFITVAIIFV